MKVTRIYTDTRDAIKAGKTVIVHEGGSRSGKTFNIVALLIRLCTENPKLHISVVSQSLPHMKRGALRDFETIMAAEGLLDMNQYNRTDKIYNFKNGAMMEFFGVDNWAKVLGPGRDILFVNEANKISFVTYQQLAWRTRKLKIVDYNPHDIQHWVYDLAEAEQGTLIHSTYKDNPFLSPEQLREIESITDPDLFRVYAEGKRGVNTGGLVFRKLEYATAPPPDFQLRYYGVDFGYNPDPVAVVELWSSMDYGTLYLREILYERELTPSAMVRKFKELKLSLNAYLVCDNSEAAMIAELGMAGFLVAKADKGPGSIKRGLLNMKRYNIIIDQNSPNLMREFGSYSYKLDLDNKPTSELEDKNNHLIDAARYAAWKHTQYYLPELTLFNN